MRTFRKLYYKFAILFTMFAMFGLLTNMSELGVLYGCICMLSGIVCFGALAIGKEDFDTEKPVRNVFAYLMWSLLGFGITATGITIVNGTMQDDSLLTAALVVSGFALIIVYIINIIKMNYPFYFLFIIINN